MLTVQDIKKRKFSKKLKGYDVEEVKKFIEDMLIFITSLKKELDKNEAKINLKENELKTLNEENNSLKESIKNLEINMEKYSSENKEYEQKIKVYIEREDSIKEVMFLAKKTGDEIIEKAETEAKDIVINAEAHEALLLKKIKTLENIIMNMKKDFSEIVNYHATVFENEINKIKSVTDE